MDRRSWTSLFVLGAIWGASYFFIKIGNRDMSPWMVAWARVALAAVVLLGPIAAVAVLGVLGTGVAFVIFYELMSNVGPARTYIVTYLAPGFAVIYGALLLDEHVTAATIAGLALIVGGSWLGSGGSLRRSSRALGGGEPELVAKT